MDGTVLRFLCNYHKQLKKRNKHFFRKAKRIASAKDSFFVYAANLWNEEDELLKCQLAIEINSWIEELTDDIGPYRRRLLVGILRKLANCGLSETILGEAWPLYFIKCKISEIGNGRDIAINVLSRKIASEQNSVVYVLNKKLNMKEKAETISKILERLVEKIRGDNESYLALVDGAYWEDLAEIVLNSEEQVQKHLIEMASHIQESRAMPVPVLYQNHMDYIRNVLSDLFKACSMDSVDVYDVSNVDDEFGLSLIGYIGYRTYVSSLQMLMPSWLKFSKSQIENKSEILNRTNACAPGSHFYWFCSFVLGVRSLLEKHKNLSGATALFEVIRLGVFGGPSNGSYSVKYINSNMPQDTEATLLLKNEVRKFIEGEKLLDAVVEYTYYLSCLHEPYGISEKRRSWFKKNIDFIFSNYDEFLHLLRRMFVGILRKEKQDDNTLLENLDLQRGQFFDGSEASLVEEDVEPRAKRSKDVEGLAGNEHEWQCFKNKVWIQPELDNQVILIELNEENAVDSLGKYLSKGAMESMVGPKYVLNSLCNYAHFKEHDLHHRNPVWIDDVQWTKIRKGKVRLLVRSIQEDLVFHVYKRKDYHSGMFD